VLSTLTPKLRQMEVVFEGSYAVCHIGALEIPRRKTGTNHYPHLRPERLERKLRLKRGSPWYHIPDEWRLVGPWPEEAAEIGIEMENE